MVPQSSQTGVSHVLGPILKFSGIIGIVQSFVWFILSVLAVSTFYCSFDLSTIAKATTLEIFMIFEYFYGPDCAGASTHPPDREIIPASIVIVMFFFVFASIIWFVASLLLLIQKNSDNTVSKPIKVFWSTLTLFICLLDLVLTVMFGIDHQYFVDNSGPSSNLVNLVPGILLGIAMRGGILWLLNAGCALYIMTRAMTNIKENTKMQQTYVGGHLDAYENQTPQGFNNNAFDWNDRPNEPIKLPTRSFPEDTHSNLAHSPGYRSTPPPVLPKPVSGNRFARKPTPIVPQPDYDSPGTRYGSRLPVLPQPDYDNQGLPRAQLRTPPQPFSPTRNYSHNY